MALMVDVEGDEGATNTGSQSEEDDVFVKSLHTKLNEANLSKILDAFEKESMTAKDLIYYCTKADIQDMITQDIKQNSPEVKISTKDKIKFIRIVMTIQQKLIQQQTAKAGSISKHDIQSNVAEPGDAAEETVNTYSDLKRMLELNADNNIEPKRIIEFMETYKDVPFDHIFEIIEDKDNNLDLRAVFDIFGFCKDNNLDAKRMFGTHYSDLVRLFQLNSDHKVASHRIVSFIHKAKDVDLQRVRNVIDDKQYRLNLMAALDLFDPDAIDLKSMFGKNYDYLKRLFILGQDQNINKKSIVRFVNNAKDIDFEAMLEVTEANNNQIDLKLIFEFVNENSTKGANIDFNRLFEVGSEAILAWAQIKECKNSLHLSTIDKESRKKQVCLNADEVTKALNEDCEWMRNRIDAIQKSTAAKIEFKKNLYLQHITKYTSPKEDADVFRNTFLQCLTNTNQSIMKTKNQLQRLHANAIASRKKASLAKSTLSVICYKGKLQDVVKFHSSSVEVTFKPLALKCPTVNGNIVRLDWGPSKPWEDKDNYVFSKLYEFNELKLTNCAFVVQYAECEDENKHENDEEIDVNWMDIKFKIRTTEAQAQWREECDILLDSNKRYKIRIQYSYDGYGASEFSNIITVQTTKETPFTKGIAKYEAVWSDTFRSKNMELKENNTLAKSIAENGTSQCIRAKNEIMKGTKIMLEFVSTSNGWKSSSWGVVRRKTTNESENDMKQFKGQSVKGFCGITKHSLCGRKVDSNSNWINGFSISSTNNIKIVIDRTTDCCTLLYVVNGLILYGAKEKRYSMELGGKVPTDDEHLYPCILIKDKGTACQIKSVEA
eukprot:43441_1